MKYVATDNLQAGMITTKNVYNDSGMLLLARNKVITEHTIRQIKRMGYEGLYIYDEFSNYEELDEVISDEDRLKTIKELKSLNIDKVLFLTNQIVDTLLESSDLCLDLNDIRSYHNYTYNHSVNVAMLAVACGIGMGLTTQQLSDLGVAAMLHDIGKSGIPLEILDKPGRLDEKEREIINTHPRLGYNMLKDNDSIKSTTRVAILSHHENENGTGYPRGLAADKIHIFAKIIHVADVYDALCSKRAYKEDYSSAESIEYLMGNCGTLFNKEIVETFIKYIVVFPVGTDVLLSNGEIAHVIKNRSRSVLRPVVMLKDKTVIDLAQDPKYLSLTVIKQIKE